MIGSNIRPPPGLLPLTAGPPELLPLTAGPPGLLPLSVASLIGGSPDTYHRGPEHRSKTLDAYYSSDETKEQARAFTERAMRKRDLWKRETGRVFIDPSAGDGSMYRGHIRDALLFDIKPEGADVMTLDYNKLAPKIEEFGGKVVIGGNPPFSREHAVKYFNATTAAPNVCLAVLIFPACFRGDQSDSYGNTMNPYFHLAEHEPLKSGDPFCKIGSTKPRIHTELQVWERRDYVRPRVEHPSVRFGKYGSTVPRGLAGTVWLSREDPRSYGGRLPLLVLGGDEPDFRKKKDQKLIHWIPMHYSDDVLDPECLGLAVITRLWEEHRHSRVSLKPGNYANALRSLESEGALARLMRKSRAATGRRGLKWRTK